MNYWAKTPEHLAVVRSAIDDQPFGTFDVSEAGHRIKFTRVQLDHLLMECQNFNGWLGFEWVLESLVRQLKLDYVGELGRFHGLSMFFLTRNCKHLVSVEAVPERMHFCWFIDELVQARAILANGDSRDPLLAEKAMIELQNRVGKESPLQLLFVDSDHTRPQIEAELEAWLPHCADDCVFVFHDTGCSTRPDRCMYPDVREWWNDALAAIGTENSWFDLMTDVGPFGLGLGIVFGKSGLEKFSASK